MTVHEKDQLITAMLPAIRDTFHLTLIPRDKQPRLIPDKVGSAMLGATLMKAEIIAQRLKISSDVPGILGTTSAVIEGLRSFFNNPQPDQAPALVQAQAAHNKAINAAHPTSQAIAPYLSTLVPPTERPARRDFI